MMVVAAVQGTDRNFIVPISTTVLLAIWTYQAVGRTEERKGKGEKPFPFVKIL